MMNWLALAFLLMASFLFSGMEAGVFALNRLRIRHLARAGKPSARLLNGFLEKPERFLWTILVGNTLANFFILGWTLVSLENLFMGHEVKTAIFFFLAVFWFYALFDLLPKMLFRSNPNSLCLSAAHPFRFINLLLSPVVSVVEGISHALLTVFGRSTGPRRLFGNREELRAIMQEYGRNLTVDERTMINRILDLQNFTVAHITKPWTEAVAVESTDLFADVLKKCREHNIMRMPVWENREGHRRVAGLLDMGLIQYQERLDIQRPVAQYMIPALFLDEATRLETALRQMQRAGQRVAIVIASDRQEVGIAAFQDILKVMFGEMNL